jgi:hypothetical protein
MDDGYSSAAPARFPLLFFVILASVAIPFVLSVGFLFQPERYPIFSGNWFEVFVYCSTTLLELLIAVFLFIHRRVAFILFCTLLAISAVNAVYRIIAVSMAPELTHKMSMYSGNIMMVLVYGFLTYRFRSLLKNSSLE